MYKIHLGHERNDCKNSNIKILPLSTFPLKTHSLLACVLLLTGLKGNGNWCLVTYTADLLTKKITQDLAIMKFYFFFFTVSLPSLPLNLHRIETNLIYASPKTSLSTNLLIIYYCFK